MFLYTAGSEPEKETLHSPGRAVYWVVPERSQSDEDILEAVLHPIGVVENLCK